MKNIGTGLIWFSAGVALTLFFTMGKGHRWIDEAASTLINDDAISEEDVKQAVLRVNKQFRQTGHEEMVPAGVTVEGEIKDEFKHLAGL